MRSGRRAGLGTMLSDSPAFTGFSVPDVDEAARFYGEVLGLRTAVEHGILTIHLAGGREHIAYPKADHEPAGFTVLNFPVEDVDAAVDWLAARGVALQRYDGMPQDEKGVMRGNGPTIAWFTDPAGNVLSVIDANGTM